MKKIIIALLLVAMTVMLASCTDVNEQVDNEMDEMIENVSDYVPGTVSENGYVSEYWDMEVQLQDGWVMMSDEELESMTAPSLQAAIESGKQELVTEGVTDPATIDKFVEAMNVGAEMGAVYYEDDVAIGQVTMIRMAITDITPEEYVRDVASGVEGALITSRDFGGKSYSGVELALNDTGVVSCIYVRKVNNMMCLVSIVYVNGCDHVLDRFDDCLK